MAEGIIQYESLVAPDAVSNLAVEFEKVIPTIELMVDKLAANLTANLNGIINPQTISHVSEINRLTKEANDLGVASAALKKAKAQAMSAEAVQRRAEIAEKKSQIDLDSKQLAGKTKEENATRKAASAYAQ